MGDRLPAQAGLTVGTMFLVYLLKSENKNWYYVGSTNRLELRLLEHNSGRVSSTKPYRPFKLVYTKSFASEGEARKYERMLKDKRMEKEKLIRSLNI